MTRYLATGAMLAIAATILIFIWASVPIVQFSWQTKQCVAVYGGGTCDSLPNKYEREWVR